MGASSGRRTVDCGRRAPNGSSSEAGHPDLRGFEPTTFRKDDAARTANGSFFATDAIALMDGLGVEGFSVVGHDCASHIGECLATIGPIVSSASLSLRRRRASAAFERHRSYSVSPTGISGSWRQNAGPRRSRDPLKARTGSAVPLHVRWEEAQPDPATVWLEDEVTTMKSLSLRRASPRARRTASPRPRCRRKSMRSYGPFERSSFRTSVTSHSAEIRNP